MGKYDHSYLEFINTKNNERFLELERLLIEDVSGVTDGDKMADPKKTNLLASVVGKVATKALNMSVLTQFDATKGDYSKVTNWKKVEDTFNMVVKTMDTKDVVLNNIKKGFIILRDYKKEFQTGYKQENDIIKLIYKTTLMTVIHGVYKLCEFNAKVIDDISKQNEPTEFKDFCNFKNNREFFQSLDKLVNADIEKLLTIKTEDKPFSLSKKTEETVKLMEKFSESSLDNILNYITFGLSSVLYYIFSPIRYLIYFFYRIGFSIQDKLSVFDKTMSMYQAKDMSRRNSLAAEISEKSLHTTINELEAIAPTQKDIEADKLEF